MGHKTNQTLLLILLASLPLFASGAPKSDLWERWLTHDASSVQTLNHVSWDDFLGRYVRLGGDGIARLPYGAVTQKDRERLASYLVVLQEARVGSLNRGEQLAFWINLYNAVTVQVVLDHHPVPSIRRINLGGGLFTRGPWRAKLITVEGESMSLDDIEHRVLRPIWKDPRIHYAINCAALGCPNLRPMAFTRENSEELLESGAREFINHSRGVLISRDRLIVSSIYKWFKVDFGGTDRGVIDHIAQYANTPLAERLSRIGTIYDYRYDWALNDLDSPPR